MYEEGEGHLEEERKIMAWSVWVCAGRGRVMVGRDGRTFGIPPIQEVSGWVKGYRD